MNNSAENRILTECIAKGSKEAFAVFYDRYADIVYHYVLTVVKNEDIAKDIVQNCFISLWNNREHLSADRSVHSFLFVSARNACYNELRRQVNAERLARNIRAMAEGEPYIEMPSLYDMHLIRDEFDVLIAKLPDARRRIFVMKVKDGMSVKEISDRLCISPKTVETQIARAWASIRHGLSSLLAFSLFFI